MAGAQGVRAGRAFVEIGADPRAFKRALADLQKSVGKLGRNFQVAGAALTAAGTAVAGTLAGAAASFASAGDAIQKMALRTGISTEALSALSFIAEQSGTDLGSLEKGIRRMQSSLLDANMGLKSANDAFGMLGVSAKSLEGLSPEEQFYRLTAALGNVEDASERAALAQRIFGRAGTALLPMIDAGEAGMAELRAEAERLGLIFDQETADKAAALTDAMNSLKRGMGAIVVQIGSAVAPIFTDLAKTFSVVAGRVSYFVKNNADMIVSVLKGGAAVAAIGGGLIGLGVALQAAAFGMGGLAKAAGLVIGPLKGIATATAQILVWLVKATVGTVAYAAQSIAAATATAAAWAVANAPLIAIGAGIAAAAALAVQAAGGFAKLGQQMQSAFSGLGEMASGAGNAVGQAFGTMLADARQVFGDLYDISTTTFGGISDALAVGDMAGAAEVAWLGLQAVWQRGIAAIMSYTDPFIEYLQNVWGNVSTFTINAVDGLFSFLRQGFRTGFAVVQGIVDNVVNGILNTFDNLVTNIRVAWTRVQGFITGAEDTQERVDKIRNEQQARREQRRQERPGVAGRLEVAGQANAEDQRNTMARQDARIAANEQAQDDRAARTAQRAEERQAGIAETTGQLDATRQRLAANRQAVDLLPSIAQAGTLEELQQLAAQIKQLEAAGASADVIERLTDQIDDRAIELDKQRADQARAGSNQAANAQQADTRPGPAQTDVVGTFSSAALGQMGFSTNLAQQQLDVQKKIEENTRRDNAGTVVE